MSLQTLSLVALLAASVQSLPHSNTRVTYADSKQHLRDDWFLATSHLSDMALSHPSRPTHELLFCVKQNNLPELKSLLESVSDPSSPRFQQYLSFSQVGDILNNTQGVEQVVDWLTAAGANVTSVTSRGEYISASAPLALWSQLLDTEFYTMQHIQSSHRISRCNAYSLPHSIAQHVQSVAYTTQLPPRHQAPRLRQATTGTTPAVNLAVLRKAYNLGAEFATQTHGSQAVFESVGQSYSPDDLTAFAKREGFTAPKITDIGGHVLKECPPPPNDTCEEANLDVQYITAVAPKVPTTFWYVTKTTSFYDYLLAVAQQEVPVLVHSISYGIAEKELEVSLKDSFDTELIKLGLIGVTVLASSGDDGVAGTAARAGDQNCGYNPSFPASSPYVTAVGATQGIETGGPEIACSSSTGGLITTGGGFSAYYAQPKWQASAVAGYFNATRTGRSLLGRREPAPGYDKTKRGYPDVSLAGHNYELVIAGGTTLESGTSASTPVFAGFVSLVNSARLAAGKPPVGFLNPALYAPNATDIYNDVTSGFNNCAAKELACCKQGFHAAKGWDPLTGWGSVDFAKFAERMV